MKRRTVIYISIFAIFVLCALFFYNYIYSIYEVKYDITNPILFCDSKSATVIKAFGINALGYKITFRNIKVDYEILEGKELIEIINDAIWKGELKIKARRECGLVIVRAKSEFSLFPAIIEIPIQVPSA